MREEGGRNMQSIHEMYQELYKAIREMPLPSSPDDPEYNEKEDYVEPEWMKHFGSTAPNAFEVEYKKALAAQLDPCGRFEIAYEKAHEWDTLYPYYGPGPEPVFVFEEDQEDPSTI